MRMKMREAGKMKKRGMDDEGAGEPAETELFSIRPFMDRGALIQTPGHPPTQRANG